MTPEQIIEGNLILANFMDLEISLFEDPPKEFSSLKFYPNELEFHMNWHLLMPVVEKIEEMVNEDSNILYKVSIYNSTCIIRDWKHPIMMHGESKIIATWKAVVSFIKHKNEIS